MFGVVWRRWNWLEDGLVPLSAVLMQAAWTFPLFALFMRNTITGVTNPGFSFWLCLAVLAGGVIAGRMASQNRMGLVIVVVGGLAAIWIVLTLTVPVGSQNLDLWIGGILEYLRFGQQGVVIPTPFIAGLCAIFLWWRGVRIATAERTEVLGSFVAGVIALVGLLLLAALLPSSPPQGSGTAGQSLVAALGPLVFLASLVAALAFVSFSRHAGESALMLSQISITVGLLFLALVLPVGPSAETLSRWILIFLGSGLTVLALHGVTDTLRRQARRVGIRIGIDRYWTVSTLGLVVAVLTLSILIGQVVAPRTIAHALSWLEPVWSILMRILLLVIYVVAYLFFSLVEPLLAGLQNQAPPNESRVFESPLRLEDIERLARDPAQMPPIINWILRAVLVASITALVVWIFVTAVRRRKRATRTKDDVIETRETILSLGLVRSQLRGLLDAIHRNERPPLFVEPGPAQDPRRAIRELYQKLLAHGIELDLPRSKSQTPRSYQQTLGYLFTEELASLERLTAAYEVARYGMVAPTAEQVQGAREAYARLEEKLSAVRARSMA